MSRIGTVRKHKSSKCILISPLKGQFITRNLCVVWQSFEKKKNLCDYCGVSQSGGISASTDKQITDPCSAQDIFSFMPSNNFTPAPLRLSAQHLSAGLAFQSILEATVNILAEIVALTLSSTSLGRMDVMKSC